MPDVGKVARKAAGDDEHGVDAGHILRAGVARRQGFSGSGDSAQAIIVKREPRLPLARARFHFDKSHNAATPGDQVDLSDGGAGAHG